MTYKSRNFAKTTLAEPISVASTVLSVATGTGSRFPTLAAGDHTMVVLQDAGNREVVKVTEVAGDSLTVERGQEGTTPYAFEVGAVVDCRMTSGVVDYLINLINDIAASMSSFTAALSGKQATISGAATTITASNLTASKVVVSDTSGKIAVSSTDAAQLAHLDGATANIQAQINALASAGPAIFTPNRVLISNASGVTAPSSITSAQLGQVAHLDGAAGNIQAQLNAKAPAAHGHNYVLTDSHSIQIGSYALSNGKPLTANATVPGTGYHAALGGGTWRRSYGVGVDRGPAGDSYTYLFQRIA